MMARAPRAQIVAGLRIERLRLKQAPKAVSESNNGQLRRTDLESIDFSPFRESIDFSPFRVSDLRISTASTSLSGTGSSPDRRLLAVRDRQASFRGLVGPARGNGSGHAAPAVRIWIPGSLPTPHRRRALRARRR